MKRILAISAAVALIMGCRTTPAPRQAAAPPRRGFAVAEATRPATFPQRVWAFADFEARPEGFGWFGGRETNNIPRYPGNTTARRGTPQGQNATLKTGMNPVPGPCMGKVNKLYVRYFSAGTDKATFQHFSLSSGDNCHIHVSGLKQDKWSETVLNFTENSRRNNRSPGAFKEGERMDDFQLYVEQPTNEKPREVIIDDPIFFAEDPALPPEPEPFPQRVMFLAAFDTGVSPSEKPKFFPGQWEAVAGDKAPQGRYWGVAKAVPREGAGDLHVLLELKPPRAAGPNTKARFRYWLKGADRIAVALHGAGENAERVVEVNGCKQGEWATQYVTFSRNERAAAGDKLAAGSPLDAIAFRAPAGEGVEFYVDEVVLFDAGKTR